MNEPWVLIIEDDAELGAVFAEILEMSGLRAELAQDGRQALDVLADTVPDLVILDLHLPEVSGPEILDYIHGDERLKKTPVVIASADVVRAGKLEDSADLVLIKPVAFDDMMGLADRFFN